MSEASGETGQLHDGPFISGRVVLGQAMERYHTHAEFHAQVVTALNVVLAERDSNILGGDAHRSGLVTNVATEAVAVALHLASHYPMAASGGSRTDR